MSRSIEELRAHIVKLDSEIDLQTKLLKNLERDKGLAQRQLNAALDPVARLPPEISSEIFLQSLSASPSGKQGLPTALLSICNAWTDIVLATPALWTTVHIHFPCGEDLAENLPMWFQRARNLPLSILITIRGPSSNWSHSVSDVLWRHGGQVKHLEILDNDSDLLAFSYDADGADDTIDLFGDTTSVSLPLLETLAIRCQRQQRMYNPSQIFQLLREAPNIVEFISHKVRTGINPAPETLVIPTLRRVIFGETSSGDDEIFLYLSLPALEALSLPMRYISGDELLACVKRSAAPLQDLALGWEFDMMESIQLHDCLRLIPSLAKFTMWSPYSYVAADFFTALADSSLLPALRDLTIHIDNEGEARISYPSWRALVHALSTRRIERLYIVPVVASPPTDVLDSLRELVANGADMWIGMEDHNFVGA